MGIGPNRLIAKLGSEHRKPDGLTVVSPEEVLDFLAPLPVASLRGLGRQTQKVFARLGIKTVAQLRAVPLRYLEEQLGTKAATSFRNQAFGIASDEVVPGRSRKSISKETTFEEDIQEQDILHDVLRGLAAEVAATARREGLSGSVVTLKIRLRPFETHTRSCTLAEPTASDVALFRKALELLERGGWKDRPVRLIGLGLSGWEGALGVQTDLFDTDESCADHHQDRLDATLDAIRDRFGRGTIQRGLNRRPRA